MCVGRGEESDGRSRENGFEGRHDAGICDLVSCLTKWNCGFDVWCLFEVVSGRLCVDVILKRGRIVEWRKGYL